MAGVRRPSDLELANLGSTKGSLQVRGSAELVQTGLFISMGLTLMAIHSLGAGEKRPTLLTTKSAEQ